MRRPIECATLSPPRRWWSIEGEKRNNHLSSFSSRFQLTPNTSRGDRRGEEGGVNGARIERRRRLVPWGITHIVMLHFRSFPVVVMRPLLCQRTSKAGIPTFTHSIPRISVMKSWTVHKLQSLCVPPPPPTLAFMIAWGKPDLRTKSS